MKVKQIFGITALASAVFFSSSAMAEGKFIIACVAPMPHSHGRQNGKYRGYRC